MFKVKIVREDKVTIFDRSMAFRWDTEQERTYLLYQSRMGNSPSFYLSLTSNVRDWCKKHLSKCPSIAGYSYHLPYYIDFEFGSEEDYALFKFKWL
jgi:hypothetical protein